MQLRRGFKKGIFQREDPRAAVTFHHERPDHSSPPKVSKASCLDLLSSCDSRCMKGETWAFQARTTLCVFCLSYVVARFLMFEWPQVGDPS